MKSDAAVRLRVSPTSLAPLLKMRALRTQRGVVTMARIHMSVIAVDAEQLTAHVAE